MAQGTSYNRDRCAIIKKDGTRCTRWVSNAGFARVAHNKAHLAAGDLIKVTKYTWKGMPLEERYVGWNEPTRFEKEGFYTSFARCIEANTPEDATPAFVAHERLGEKYSEDYDAGFDPNELNSPDQGTGEGRAS